MEQMTRKLMLAVLLGVFVGVALGYSPMAQPSYAPKPQLLMQQTAQPNAATFNSHASPPLIPIIVAVLVGLAAAAPVFLIARRRAG